MSLTEIDFELPLSGREAMRTTLIRTMLSEQPGAGRGELCARYQYNVESFQDYTIFLKRPTQLNKGFDFTVNIGGIWFKKTRRYSNPSHEDIFASLSDCKNTFPAQYASVAEVITKIYNCEAVDLSQATGITFHDYEGREHPIEVIILAIKWLFMEQDCAYWNYSGRAMFYSALRTRNLL